MNYTELKIFLIKCYREWHKNVEDSSTNMSLWEFIADKLITNDIVKE